MGERLHGDKRPSSGDPRLQRWLSYAEMVQSFSQTAQAAWIVHAQGQTLHCSQSTWSHSLHWGGRSHFQPASPAGGSSDYLRSS